EGAERRGAWGHEADAPTPVCRSRTFAVYLVQQRGRAAAGALHRAGERDRAAGGLGRGSMAVGQAATLREPDPGWCRLPPRMRLRLRRPEGVACDEPRASAVGGGCFAKPPGIAVCGWGL